MTPLERIVWDAQQTTKNFPVLDREATEADAALATAKKTMMDAIWAGRDGEVRYHASTVTEKEAAAKQAHQQADDARQHIQDVVKTHGVELRQALASAKAAIATAQEQIGEWQTVLDATRELALSTAPVDADAATRHTKEVTALLREIDELQTQVSANERIVSDIEEVLK
jgi:hypothetical protein